jgi:hypothetical protein
LKQLPRKTLWRSLENKSAYPSFIRVLIYANVFIAICAASQAALTQRLFNIRADFTSLSYIAFIMLSTYVQYNMQRGYVIAQDHNHSERAQWVVRHKKIMLLSNAACLLILLFLCNNLSWTAIGIMVGAELVSTFYYMPPFNLRRYGYIKPFLLGAVWTISCGLVPMIENNLLSIQASCYLLSQFCFISALCILFDVKDSVADIAGNVRTYANVFGAMPSRILAAVLMVIAAISFLFVYASLAAKIANTSVMALSVLLTFFSHDKRHAFYYYLYIDGLMLLQAVGVGVTMLF